MPRIPSEVDLTGKRRLSRLRPRARRPDISDARWALIAATLLAWQQARLDRRPTGEPARTDVREVFNAILYVSIRFATMIRFPDLPPTGPRRPAEIVCSVVGALGQPASERVDDKLCRGAGSVLGGCSLQVECSHEGRECRRYLPP
jgi:hypothetical protein